MSIYKVFDKDKQEYWYGTSELKYDRIGKTFITLTEVLDRLELLRAGSSWSGHDPQPIPSSWVIIEYELKEVHHFNAKEYAEAR